MLSLNPGSVCDVCAEEYGPSYLPHCIPCGHILCAACCNKIIEKTSPRLSPACPFCRLSFTTEGIRKIRIDFTSSGRSTPRAPHVTTIEAPTDAAFPRGVVKEDRLPPSEKDRVRLRAKARWLEDRVAKAASTKTSVDEVAMLQNEVDEWLRSSDLGEEQPMSLRLSSALLRAILTNYHAYADLSKSMKSTEANLKAQIEELESAAGNLQVELRKLKAQQAQKAEECQSLRVELNRLKIKAAASNLGMPTNTSSTSFGSAASSVSGSRPVSPTSPTYSDPRSAASSRATSPLASPSLRNAYTPLVSPIPKPASPVPSPMHSPPTSPSGHSAPRYTSSSAHPSSSSSSHYRSASSSGYRSTTPVSTSTRTPASPSAYRSHTPAYPIVIERSETPTPPSRSASVRRPSISTRVSTGAPAPPKMLRSASEEERERARESVRAQPEKVQQSSSATPEKHRYVLHQRWLPGGATDQRAPSAPPAVGPSRPSHTKSSSISGHTSKASSPLSPSTSRTVSAAYSTLPTRLGTALRA